MSQGTGGEGPVYAVVTGVECENYAVLLDESGSRLWTSVPADDANAARSTIPQARTLGPDIEAYERWHVAAGWGFTLRGPDGELAHSEPFASEEARDAAVERSRECAATPKVVDLTFGEPTAGA